MKQKVKENISILKLVPLVRKKMKDNGWEEAARLSEASSVSTGTVSKFLNRGEVSGENLCKIIMAVGLVKLDDSTDTSALGDHDLKEAHDLLKKVYTHGKFKKALKENLVAFGEAVDTVKEKSCSGKVNPTLFSCF